MCEHDKSIEVIQADISGIHSELRRLNGRVDDLARDVWGDPKQRHVGLKPQVQDHHDLIERGKGIMWFLGAITLAQTAMTIIWASHLFGG